MKPAGSHGVGGGVLRVAVAWVNIGSIPSTPAAACAAPLSLLVNVLLSIPRMRHIRWLSLPDLGHCSFVFRLLRLDNVSSNMFSFLNHVVR